MLNEKIVDEMHTYCFYAILYTISQTMTTWQMYRNIIQEGRK